MFEREDGKLAGEEMSDLNPYVWNWRLRALLVVSVLTGSCLGGLVGIDAAERTEQYSADWSDITSSIEDFRWTELRGVHRPVRPE
jgi:hypothetical protein